MEFYNSIIDESIAVLGFIGAVAATWTLLAFIFTRIFTRSMMKRRLLGHAAFWMAVCGAIDFMASMDDRKLVNGDDFELTRTDIAMSLLRYSAAIISRMLVTASVASIAFSYGVPLQSCTSGQRRWGYGASMMFGDESTTPLLRRSSDDDKDYFASGARGVGRAGGAQPDWSGSTAIMVETSLHLGCIAVGAVAVAITLVAGVDEDSLKSGFVFGLCWPWLVFNLAQVIVAAALLLFNVVASTCGLLFIARCEAGVSKASKLGTVPARESSVIVVVGAENDDGTERTGDEDAVAADLRRGSIGSSTSTSDVSDFPGSHEHTYEYQWEAELDFLPTLTRTERLFAYVNFEVFCCLVNFVVNVVTTVSMSFSRGTSADGSSFPRLESSLLYFDGIVSALRGCWLFALYGYRPGVLYAVFIIKKYLRRGSTAANKNSVQGAASCAFSSDDGAGWKPDTGSGRKNDDPDRDLARLVATFAETWHTT